MPLPCFMVHINKKPCDVTVVTESCTPVLVSHTYFALPSSWRRHFCPSSPRAFPKPGQRPRSRLRWANSRPRRQRRIRAQRTQRIRMTLQIQPQTIPQRALPSPLYLAPQVQQLLRMVQTIPMVHRRSVCQTQKARQFRRRHGHPRPPSQPISATNLPLAPHRLPSNLQSRHLPPSTSLSLRPSSPTPPHLLRAPHRAAHPRQTRRSTAVQRTR